MTKEKLIDRTDSIIQSLVYNKLKLQKAYNYYHGVRDAAQFKYLEDIYGVNTPTSIEFTPLIKKHIDALVGEYLSLPTIPKISCKDKNTLSNIHREKQLSIALELQKYLTTHLKNSVIQLLNGKNPEDPTITKQLKDLVEDIELNFISEYEIAAQNVVKYIMQSRETDFANVKKDMILDLLITGSNYYQVTESLGKNNIKIKVLNPLNTFVETDNDTPYIKNASRAVYREWCTNDQILNRYGELLSKEDVAELRDKWEEMYSDAYNYNFISDDIDHYENINSVNDLPGYPRNQSGKSLRLLPVYHVEWLETDSNFVMQRYKTIRIGASIYILIGKDEKVIRSISNPTECHLSINGVQFLNRGNEPYSMVLSCAHLQDQYDLLHYYRDNLIASSGTIGNWIDLPLIPEKFGNDMFERLRNWQAYYKQGLGVLDSSQEGRLGNGGSTLNTIFNGFDSTVKAEAIQAVQYAIDSVEQTVTSITGVFRERLNGITSKDAVSNVEIGQKNSFIITKQYYHHMDLAITEVLLDSLNLSKKVFKNGLVGVLLLGDKQQKIFTALPEHFTVSDHDIHLITSSDVYNDLETIKTIIPEFVKSGGLPPDIIIDAVTSKSIPDLKYKISKALQIQKSENNQIQQLSQQLQELQNQLQQANSQLQEAGKEIQKLQTENSKLEAAQESKKHKIEYYKAETDRTYKEAMAAQEKRRTDVEVAQLYDGNPYNDEIKNL